MEFPSVAEATPWNVVAETSLPPIDAVAPGGERVTITDLRADTTAAELAAAFGMTAMSIDGQAIDGGRRLAMIPEMVVGCSLGAGHVAENEGRGPTEHEHSLAEPLVEIAVTGGSDCTGWIPLARGRHILGRARHADLVIDDPTLEWHHAVLDVTLDGSILFTQLAGSVPARLAGRAIGVAARVPIGCHLDLGGTVVSFRSVDDPSKSASNDRVAGSIAPHASDPWRRVVWRSALVDEPPGPRSVVAPQREVESARPPATGLIGAGVAAVGAAAVALVMRNPIFVLFAALGAVSALVTWCVGAWTAHRQGRHASAEHTAAIDRFRSELVTLQRSRLAQHRVMHPDLNRTLHCAVELSPGLWHRRVGHAGSASLSATLGTGTTRWTPPVEVGEPGNDADPQVMELVEQASRLDDVTLPVTIEPGDTIALHGSIDRARSVVRSVVVQLATWVGPADWSLVVVSPRTELWSWVDWLPHGARRGVSLVSTGDADGLAEALTSIDTSRRLLVVTDEPELLTSRTGALRRLLDRTDASLIVAVDTDTTVPAPCRRVLRIGSRGRGSWIGDVPESDAAIDLAIAGISVATAEGAARRLARLVDPEDPGSGDGLIPSMVPLGRLLGHDAHIAPDDVVAQWSDGGADPSLCTPIGVSGDGVVDLDLVRDGPHGLIAGTTGSGKSELLRSLVLGLAVRVSPAHLNIVLVDYKGGSTFDACAALPHTVGVVTDLDEGLAERALVSLSAEMHRRERLLREVGAADLSDYRARTATEPIARLVVVVDEFAALAAEHPDFLASLVDIAQRGRSLGVHLLLATQRPAGVVSDEIRANTNLRIALRLSDRSDALDVVADPRPAALPRDVPGRAVLSMGPDEIIVFQSARCTGSALEASDRGVTITHRSDARSGDHLTRPADRGSAASRDGTQPATELAVVVDACRRAAADVDLFPAHRPWTEPLPHPLTDLTSTAGGGEVLSDDTAGVIGLLDDPVGQCRRPLTWEPADGSLALIGSFGTGTTSTLISIATATCRRRAPRDVHLHVIDARGDEALMALSDLAHCSGVVRIAEIERLHRLLARLVSLIERRQAGQSTPAPETVVMIDGWSSLRASLGSVERTELHEMLQRLVMDGPAIGVVTVVSDDGGPAALSGVTVADRWVFGLDDPSMARAFGIAATPIRTGRPGRLRIASSGLEAQVLLGAAGLAEIPTRDVDGSGPDPIEVLPSEVCRPHPVDGAWRSWRDRAGRHLAVGLGGACGAPLHLRVPIGDPVLIVGGPRTGVSTALAAVQQAWIDVSDRAPRVMAVDGRVGICRSTLDSVVGDGSREALIVVDDAHRVDDVDGLLAMIARGDHGHVSLVVAGRADVIRSSYGHWTREVARARCGIVMSSREDPDGDVFGVTIPRRPLVSARPGLGWLIDGGPVRQVQLARS